MSFQIIKFQQIVGISWISGRVFCLPNTVGIEWDEKFCVHIKIAASPIHPTKITAIDGLLNKTTFYYQHQIELLESSSEPHHQKDCIMCKFCWYACVNKFACIVGKSFQGFTDGLVNPLKPKPDWRGDVFISCNILRKSVINTTMSKIAKNIYKNLSWVYWWLAI